MFSPPQKLRGGKKPPKKKPAEKKEKKKSVPLFWPKNFSPPLSFFWGKKYFWGVGGIPPRGKKKIFFFWGAPPRGGGGKKRGVFSKKGSPFFRKFGAPKPPRGGKPFPPRGEPPFFFFSGGGGGFPRLQGEGPPRGTLGGGVSNLWGKLFKKPVFLFKQRGGKSRGQSQFQKIFPYPQGRKPILGFFGASPNTGKIQLPANGACASPPVGSTSKG